MTQKLDDTQLIGELFMAVWNVFPDDPAARRRIYLALDAEGISQAGQRAARISDAVK